MRIRTNREKWIRKFENYMRICLKNDPETSFEKIYHDFHWLTKHEPFRYEIPMDVASDIYTTMKEGRDE